MLRWHSSSLPCTITSTLAERPSLAISTDVTVAKPNARIGQFTFDDSFNLFPQGLAQALPMIFVSPLLHISPRIKPMRISEIDVNGMSNG